MFFWILAAVPLLFILVSILLGILTPNYSQRTNEISYLIYGRYGIWQSINFVGCGVLTILLAFVLPNAVGLNADGLFLLQLGALCLGLSLILLRVFPTQLKGQKTIVSEIHKMIFVGSVLIQAILQLLFAHQQDYSWPIFFYISGLITLLGLPAMLYFRPYRGIAQRILVGAIMLWISFGSVLLFQLSRL